MGEVRLNCEKKIDSKNFKIKLGTINKLDPQVVYVEGKTFICPKEDKDDYLKDISEIKHTFKSSISNNLRENTHFNKNFIIDFQIASKGISLNKKSFLSFQFLLKQCPNNIIKLKDLKPTIEPLINNVVEDLETDIYNHNFTIYKTKSNK